MMILSRFLGTAVIFCFTAITTIKGQEIRVYQKEHKDKPCRMEKEALCPIISPTNPFFFNHTFDDNTKTEQALLTPGRYVTITQKACLRHHTKLRLSIAPKVVDHTDMNTYVTELFNLMNRLYFYEPDYYSYKIEFEDSVIKYFNKHRLESEFNFHIADYTFICSFEGGDWGISINLEIIKLLHSEEIVKPGIKPYLDDGHFKPVR
ncbi:MAG: hypothetical protein RML72_04450 [Bacteroidia bacterium]|nr:hypothetical protein [Bacteroidia bacterium]MDW8158113.1 hypothetical protein [Bacteroidia bacterium]